MVKFERVTQDHIEYVATNMRKQDVDEVMASSGHTPLHSLTQSVEYSHLCATLTVDGTPVLILGLCIHNVMKGIGSPWLLGTQDVVKYKKQLLPTSDLVIPEMLKITPYLYNHVHKKNLVSIRWLSWLGFKIDKSTEYRLHDKNEVFYKFEMRV